MVENGKTWLETHLWGAVQSILTFIGLCFTVWMYFNPRSAPALIANAINPKDENGGAVRMSTPLLVVLLLLFLSILVPKIIEFTKDFVHRRRIRRAIGLPQSGHPNGMTDDQWKQHCDSVAFQNRLIEIGRSLDGVLGPRQIEALQLSTDLLKFLERMGPEPLPRYTREELMGMPLAQQRALIDAQDGDYAEAHEYYSREGATWFLPRTWQNAEGVSNELMARWNRLFPWYQKIASGYALEMKSRVETIRHRFIVDGFGDETLVLPVEGRDGTKHIRMIASTLWQLAYKTRELEIRLENVQVS